MSSGKMETKLINGKEVTLDLVDWYLIEKVNAISGTDSVEGGKYSQERIGFLTLLAAKKSYEARTKKDSSGNFQNFANFELGDKFMSQLNFLGRLFNGELVELGMGVGKTWMFSIFLAERAMLFEKKEFL